MASVNSVEGRVDCATQWPLGEGPTNIVGAILAMQSGSRVRRYGWPLGKFLFIVKAWNYTDGKQDNYTNSPFIACKCDMGTVSPWMQSQEDIAANDWRVL